MSRPLFQADAKPELDPASAAHAAHAFLMRCQAWAREREIPQRIERIAATPDPAEAAKLHAWIAYLQFTEHALHEIERGELDDWFIADWG